MHKKPCHTFIVKGWHKTHRWLCLLQNPASREGTGTLLSIRLAMKSKTDCRLSFFLHLKIFRYASSFSYGSNSKLCWGRSTSIPPLEQIYFTVSTSKLICSKDEKDDAFAVSQAITWLKKCHMKTMVQEKLMWSMLHEYWIQDWHRWPFKNSKYCKTATLLRDNSKHHIIVK